MDYLVLVATLVFRAFQDFLENLGIPVIQEKSEKAVTQANLDLAVNQAILDILVLE